jgi:hypothetical protein
MTKLEELKAARDAAVAAYAAADADRAAAYAEARAADDVVADAYAAADAAYDAYGWQVVAELKKQKENNND